MATKKLKLALLIDCDYCDIYAKELIHWINQDQHIHFTGFIKIATTDKNGQKLATINTKTKRTLLEKLNSLFTSLIEKNERPRVTKIPLHQHHFDRYNINEISETNLVFHPNLTEQGYTFQSDDIEKIKQLGIDLILNLSDQKISGSILTTPTFGVIKVSYEDQAIKRGGPTGFWECFYQWPTTGFVIKRLADDNNEADVIKHGRFPTQYFYHLNHAFLKRKVQVHLKSFLSTLAAEGKFRPFGLSIPYSYTEYKTPTIYQQFKYVLALRKIKFKARIERITKLHERWTVLLIRSSWKNASFEKGTIIPNPEGRFFADPFIFVNEGRNYLFVEDYVYTTKRAHITVLDLDHDIKELGSPIIEPFHLSFPYMFRFDGQIYMCPESSEAKQIRLYKCVDFPLKWEFQKPIIDNISAVDSMLFEHNGLWWMLTNIDASGTSDHCSELYLYYAKSPLDDDWTPHPLNPLVIDSEYARNAGIIIEGDRIFRIAQCQGFAQYGKSFSIREIITLSTDRYEERYLGQIDPKYRNKLYGTHHLSTTGLITVIDCLFRSPIN